MQGLAKKNTNFGQRIISQIPRWYTNNQVLSYILIISSSDEINKK